MRNFIVALMVVLFTTAAWAAEITPTKSRVHGKDVIIWEGIATGDTTATAVWSGGAGIVFASGTQATAIFEVEYDPVDGTNLQDIDGDAAPDGFTFNGTTTLEVVPEFNLPPGHIGITFSSAGTSTQDIDIRIMQIERK
jgi:hypothetical protein